MKRNKILKILNPILGLLVLNQAITGIFHDAISPQTFEIIHEGGGYTLVVIACLHVILNWTWIKANLFANKKKDKK